MGRTPCYDNHGLKKGTWTKEEDEKLKAYVTKYGCWNWRLIPKFAGLSRCGKSCRLRWMNYLRSDIKRGNFQKEEDETILQLHETLGNRWSAIAAHLPGRTDNEIKNRWNTILKKHSDQKPSKNSNLETGTASSSSLICSQRNSPQEDSNQTHFVLNSAADHEGTNLGKAVAEADQAEVAGVGFSTQLSMELGGNLWTDPFISEETFSSPNNPTDVSMDPFEYYEKFPSFFDDFLWP